MGKNWVPHDIQQSSHGPKNVGFDSTRAKLSAQLCFIVKSLHEIRLIEHMEENFGFFRNHIGIWHNKYIYTVSRITIIVAHLSTLLIYEL